MGACFECYNYKPQISENINNPGYGVRHPEEGWVKGARSNITPKDRNRMGWWPTFQSTLWFLSPIDPSWRSRWDCSAFDLQIHQTKSVGHASDIHWPCRNQNDIGQISGQCSRWVFLHLLRWWSSRWRFQNWCLPVGSMVRPRQTRGGNTAAWELTAVSFSSH